MSRSYPPVPPDPTLYRIIFFAPLFVVEILTLSLLLFSPMVKLTRSTFLFFGLMLVFASWGLFGFTYPSSPLSLSLNVLSKILAFVAAVSLFFPLGNVRSAVRRSGRFASVGTPHAS